MFTFRKAFGIVLSLAAAASTVGLILYFLPQVYYGTSPHYKILDAHGIPSIVYPFIFGMIWSAIQRVDAHWGAGRSNRVFQVIDVVMAALAIIFFVGSAVYVGYNHGLNLLTMVLIIFAIASVVDGLFNLLHYADELTPDQRLAYGIDSILVATQEYGRGFTAIPTRPGFITLWSYRDEAGNHYREDADGNLVALPTS